MEFEKQGQWCWVGFGPAIHCKPLIGAGFPLLSGLVIAVRPFLGAEFCGRGALETDIFVIQNQRIKNHIPVTEAIQTVSGPAAIGKFVNGPPSAHIIQ